MEIFGQSDTDLQSSCCMDLTGAQPSLPAGEDGNLCLEHMVIVQHNVHNRISSNVYLLNQLHHDLFRATKGKLATMSLKAH